MSATYTHKFFNNKKIGHHRNNSLVNGLHKNNSLVNGHHRNNSLDKPFNKYKKFNKILKN